MVGSLWIGRGFQGVWVFGVQGFGLKGVLHDMKRVTLNPKLSSLTPKPSTPLQLNPEARSLSLKPLTDAP